MFRHHNAGQKYAPNVIANIRHAVKVRRSCNAEKLKLISDNDDSGSKKCKQGYDGAHKGVLWSRPLAGAWSQAVDYTLVRLAGICSQ